MAETKKLINDGVRYDGRKLDEMRPITAQVGVLHKAQGSALFALGNTMAVAGVYGPREVHPRHEEERERAILRTKYNMAPFATTTRGRPGPNRRSKEISLVTREALKSVVFLEEYPKTAIDVHIEVLQADASTRCVGINAATLALADAGVPMRDLIASCAVGKVEDTVVLDVVGKEDTEGQVDLPIAYYPKKNKITLLQMDGITDRAELRDMVKLAINGCKQVYEKQQEALRIKYGLEGLE